MKTYKRGISLIVLVITVIILSILATTVIVNLSNTNIIELATNTVFKSDMKSYQEMYSLYKASSAVDNNGVDTTANLNAVYGDPIFTTIFGDNVPEKYQASLEIQDGNLVYNGENATESQLEILTELGMVRVPDPVLTIGDIVNYTPSVSADAEVEGVDFIYDESVGLSKSTKNYIPGTLNWVYMGPEYVWDEEESNWTTSGNILLASQEPTTFDVSLGGTDAYANFQTYLDTLCNNLYGNNTYGTVRNMKTSDIDGLLGYTGPFTQVDSSYEAAESYTFYSYDIDTLKDTDTNEFKLVSKVSDYWLSSSYSRFDYEDKYIAGQYDGLFVVNTSNKYSGADLQSESFNDMYGGARALRPVVVLNDDYTIGEKVDGKWQIVPVASAE